MRSSLINILLFGVIVAVVMLWNPSAGSVKTVHIQYNKFGWTADTKAKDVSEFLIQTFGGYENWQVTPTPETRLSEGTVISVADGSTSPLSEVVAANLKTEVKRYEEEKKQAEPKSPIYSGTATWYRFGNELTTASRRFPKGTKLRVIAVNSGKTVEVVVNDYGPEGWTGVELDLNEPAFAKLASLGAGKIKIKYFKI